MFKRKADIVAAELLSVKDKMSLIDAIAFPMAGEHVAGLAGALVGASLVPSKLIYTYRVFREDGSYDKIKLSGDDPRNDAMLSLPYTPDYIGQQEREKEMADSMMSNPPAPQVEPVQMSMQPQIESQQHEQSTSTGAGEAIIGAGNYVFGGNFPTGAFDLQVLSGEGSLWIYDAQGEGTYNWMGGDRGAMGWNGLTSESNRSFTLDGSLRVKVTRAQMIQV